MKHSTILIAISLIFSSCTDENQKTRPSIQTDQNGVGISVASTAALPLFKTNLEEFQLRGNHARLIRTEKGTRIHVPSKAFVNKVSGDPVKGDVVLTFNEYHTHGELLSSGIPMVHTTPEGDTINFESAGMFDVRAFQDGNELELAEGKEIEVEFANDAEEIFEFYAFNEVEKSWILTESECNPVVNPYIAKQRMELEKLEEEMPATPKKLINYKKGDPLFDVKRYGSQDEALDALNGVYWKFTGDSTQIDPSKNNATFNKTYNFVQLINIDSSDIREYDMVFRGENEEVIVRAAPIFQGKLLTRENARMARILSQIEYAMRFKAQLEVEMAQEKAFMRTMKVSKMGIYGYHRRLNDEKAIPFIAEFTFDGEVKNEAFTIYLLPLEKRCVIKYKLKAFDEFRINPFETNRLIAVFPNKTIYVLSAAEIRKMNLARKTLGSKVVFDLKKYGELIETAEELDDVIQTL